MNNKIKKFIILVLIASQLIIYPSAVFAQILSVPVSDSNNGNTPGGSVGIAANTAAQVAIIAAQTTNQTCVSLEQAYFKSSGSMQGSFSGFSLIGGSSVLMGLLKADQIAIEGPPGTTPASSNLIPDGFIPCRKFALNMIDKVVATNIFISNQKQDLHNQITIALNSLAARDETVKARLANATQGFWKTLMFNVLIKLSKSVATTLVNKLVNNYKIANIKKYADSVATLMYDNQYLRDNFPDNQGQLMARAILENPTFRTQIQPSIFIAADTALGFDPKILDTSDPNYYTKMASAGSSMANPYLKQTVYVSSVDQAHASSLASANQLIGQGNGYKAPVNCAGSLAQQQSLDRQNKALQDQLDNRKALLKNLTDAKSLGKPVSDSDLKKAQADYDAALANWNKLPYTVTGTSSVASLDGGNSTEGSIAMVMCEAISSPAVLVNQGIDAVLKNFAVNLNQYDSNNLPGYINIIGDVASQIGSNLILGGSGAAKNSLLMNESKLVTATVNAAQEAVASNMAANLANGIVFTADSDPNTPNGYVLNWNVITDESKVSTASFVTISGNGMSATKTDPTTKQTVPNKLPVSGSYSLTTTSGGPYIMNVYDSTGKLLTAATLTITPTTQAYNYNSNAPAVAGAFTNKPSLDIRGPALDYSPR